MGDAPNSQHLVRFGSFELDRVTGELRKSGVRIKLDPGWWFARVSEVYIHYQIDRDYAKAITKIKSLVENQPDRFDVHLKLGDVYLGAGMYPEALAAFEKARGISDNNLALASLRRAYAAAGKTREAREILDELLLRSEERRVSSVHFATIYVGLGEPDRALDALEKAYDERAAGLISLKVRQEWDPVRTHPRFQALLKKMNFPE